MALSLFASRVRVAFVSAVAAASLAGCARVQEVSPVRIPFIEAKPEVTTSPRLSAQPPRSVAVLPFSSIAEAGAGKTDGRAILRKNFSSYFQALPFACKDAKEIDALLSRGGLSDIKDINKADAAKLGSLLNVDAVVYGDIKSAINFTGGVYSLTELNGTLTMTDARTGEVLWKVKHFEKSIGGLITESDQLVTAIESQIENAKASLAYQRCADDFSRKVMTTLPAFKADAGALPNVERVVVRPEGKKLFSLFDTVEIELCGDPGLPARFDIGTLRENVPMTEVQPGVY
ncbi:MAG TPA: DUF799 family lipoprotein, partial [bacterium]|nr:DUF799 family lipoprotein [bacterium]